MAEADIRHVTLYTELAGEISQLEAKLTGLKSRREKLKDGVLAYFERHGVQNHTANGITLYVRRELWAGRAEGVTGEEFTEAVQAAGLGQFVKVGVSTQSFSAYCRELDEDGTPVEEMHPELAGKIKVTETFKIGQTKARAKGK